jgi:hypothetical protein
MTGDVANLRELQTSDELDICNALMIDNDLHPSTLGYLYINGAALYRDHKLAVASARSIYMAGINALISQFTAHSTAKTLICGDSSAVASLKRAVPLGTLKTLSGLGVELRPEIKDLGSALQVESVERIIFMSTKILDVGSDEDLAYLRSGPREEKVTVFFWNTLATLTMQWRARNQRGLPTGLREKMFAKEILGRLLSSQESFDFNEYDRLIEHGAGGAPTAWALFLILAHTQGPKSAKLLASSAIQGMQRASDVHYKR